MIKKAINPHLKLIASPSGSLNYSSERFKNNCSLWRRAVMDFVLKLKRKGFFFFFIYQVLAALETEPFLSPFNILTIPSPVESTVPFIIPTPPEVPWNRFRAHREDSGRGLEEYDGCMQTRMGKDCWTGKAKQNFKVMVYIGTQGRDRGSDRPEAGPRVTHLGADPAPWLWVYYL